MCAQVLPSLKGALADACGGIVESISVAAAVQPRYRAPTGRSTRQRSATGFVPEVAIAGIGKRRINPVRAGCFCLLSPPDSNSRGGGTAAIAGATHGDE